MKRSNGFFFYTCMWVAAVLVLMALLMQSFGDARIVNYSGIVRGATQKLVKEEINGQPNDALLLQLDGIIDNLRTGEGEFDLQRNEDQGYQDQLVRLNQVWEQIKAEIYRVRQGQASPETLYALSEQHFIEADQMVLLAEESSERKLHRFIVIYGVVLLVSVCVFTLLDYRNRKALENSICTDNMTGILNRTGFEVSAGSLLRRCKNQYCLIEFDIDDFKFLNNSYGYEVEDQLLCALAEQLQKNYHTTQLCARTDADDFVILALHSPQLLKDLQRLFAATLQQESLRNLSEIVTFTVGGYEITDNGEVIQSVMDKANMAHKSAKALGKSMMLWYNKKLTEQLNRENILKNRMRRGLEAGEFRMYLQPKYRLEDLTVHSAEALVRWDIPGEGVVPPDDFIPLFERNGYIADIDFYMLDQACRYIQQHRDGYGSAFSVAVNFSRVTIYQQRFFDVVLETVDRYHIPHHCIELEVTESAFNEISDVAVKKILRLQQEGFIISMDDFGSGYSSLNLLDRLPFQELKLDREFLREFSSNDRVKNVIGCIVDLAHTLDIQVVCEGIEQQEQMEFLQEIGCDIGQGFFFSRPVPQEEFAEKCGAVLLHRQQSSS